MDIAEFNDLIKVNSTFEKILNNSFGNIFVSDAKGKIIFLNENAANSLNGKKNDLIGMTVYDMVENEFSDSSAIIDVIEKKTEIVKKIKTISGITLLVTAKPIYDNNGNLEMIVVFSQNEIIMKNFIESINKEKNTIQRAYDFILENNLIHYPIVAESAVTNEVFKTAKRAAFSDSTIMLYGESGTGKEIVSRFIHKNSMRASSIFLPINCAAIPDNLMESEFFGYEKGAFTGSSKNGKLGLFEVADGGTLFLDEIGELSLSMQSKLLRVLESGEIKPVAGNKIKRINTRIVAATNKDLGSMVTSGEFREDLYYRLNVIPIIVPPLRERKEDILALAELFLDNYNKKYGTKKFFTENAFKEFKKYNWPGNIRELKNIIERIFVTSSKDRLDTEEVIKGIGIQSNVVRNTTNFNESEKQNILSFGHSLKLATENFQREYISTVLKECNGNVYTAADKLGVHKSGLYKKLHNLQLI